MPPDGMACPAERLRKPCAAQATHHAGTLYCFPSRQAGRRRRPIACDRIPHSASRACGATSFFLEAAKISKSKKFDLAIFDFDGTLADSFPFFISVFNELARRHDFSSIDMTHAHGFRGYNVRQMMQHVGLPQWKLPFVARSFMALMKENSHRIPLFGGIGDMLARLNGQGIKLAIVTSNSRENLAAVLGKENMALIRHIESGASIFGKASKIARVLERSRVPCEHAIYIGDQVPDLEAARKANIAFGAVAWGYATIESLLAHHPDHAFHSVAEIERLTEAGPAAGHDA